MRAARRKCPICGKAAKPRAAWFPFCSKRCRTQDLANWASGSYSIPAPASEADEYLDPRRDPHDGPWDG
jgi:endogenous inhibitor of DNA gyrase (YacG/DUF329 family)